MLKYGGWESSTCCNFKKHMQKEKAPANQENVFISLTAGAANAHNTNKWRILCAVRYFICLCCKHLQIEVLSNWRSCFLNLLVFFLFSMRFFICLCCKHLQRVCCQIEEVVFLICWCFFFYFQCVSLFVCVVSNYVLARVLSNWRGCFLNLQIYFFIALSTTVLKSQDCTKISLMLIHICALKSSVTGC